MSVTTFEADAAFWALFSVVLLTRFIVPFAMFRWPLVAVVACLVIDGVDQTIFQTFGYDPPFYQSYDKAMDVFYLGIAYVSTMRNWTSLPAVAVARALFFYRQFGVTAFELSHVRALLLIFPNTFEYFFIAYEAIRTRWRTERLGMRQWIGIAAAIWIFVKLPQEYWIHIAQLDVTDTLRDVPWALPALVSAIIALALVIWFVVRPRLAPADHRFTLATPAIPDAVSSYAARAAFRAEHDRIWSWATLDKTMLIGLLLLIFSLVLPTSNPRPFAFIVWIGVFVVVNTAILLRRDRRGVVTDSLLVALGLRLGVNIALLVATDLFFDRSLPLADAAFSVVLFSVIVTAYDRYRPVLDYRSMHVAAAK